MGIKAKNPYVDEYTILIMDLKAGRANKQAEAIKKLSRMLEDIVEKNIVIAVVPPHDPSKKNSGILKLAKVLVAAGRIDGTDWLVRHTAVKKKATGGERDISVDLQSIRVHNAAIVEGKAILLLDDVTTTGNSLSACKELLERAGAHRVQRLAIGKTVH